MKQDTLKDLQILGKEHGKLKSTIIEMCEQLDSEEDLKQKEVIKIAIETSRMKLDDIEHKYKQLLDKF